MQNYKNHARNFAVHNYVLIPLALAFFIWTVVNLVNGIIDSTDFSGHLYHMIAATLLLLLPLVARYYGLKNQDRIIRLEMRFRYFELTGKSFKEKESKLKLSQIISLRFAGDDELLPLIEKAIKEDMKAKEIKLAINNWQEDNRRV
ncbi:DUF6526 family protein [Aquiflexum sp. TKW24L]|uniref:DUF6526 family protein n=1 Tax=Aquiflexum sp. TKW24L TaxID=2942212 RepID=UPI0020C03640|nr:DUF6526 family protein [Aquiflexum sp. TKW24L]MCL6261426.1 DUF6526 family protein [Aquiflexum sp. TKW24L]